MITQLKIKLPLAVALAFNMSLPVVSLSQEKKTDEQKSEEKKAEKAKGEKVSGDIGLLDTEKNYMIVVTKDGKLVTLDFNQKTKVTELKEKPSKMSDVGLGSTATVEYTTKGEKNFLSKIEFLPAKGE